MLQSPGFAARTSVPVYAGCTQVGIQAAMVALLELELPQFGTRSALCRSPMNINIPNIDGMPGLENVLDMAGECFRRTSKPICIRFLAHDLPNTILLTPGNGTS
ncbi:hypothetical protein CERZMDRAFT_103264 [Cercospora zeae-maydis SCOH1-5]|uniref:Uncharacterized protein n=1 Tax=Cercospora zeae-maydis SCOH1-5 TaxID=717836 RepID=A0A6A6F027_9PEZI|nr:hypothetical protein CERZMDRAFT_103264 [Cercospora zeae-maydis SCOH1-5]